MFRMIADMFGFILVALVAAVGLVFYLGMENDWNWPAMLELVKGWISKL